MLSFVFDFLTIVVKPIAFILYVQFKKSKTRQALNPRKSVFIFSHRGSCLKSQGWSFMITLAISKCYGKVRVLFFPRDNSLVSDRKSHNSDFFGLAVRCLLFNPEGPGSNPCLYANFFYKIFEAEDSHFFRKYEI